MNRKVKYDYGQGPKGFSEHVWCAMPERCASVWEEDRQEGNMKEGNEGQKEETKEGGRSCPRKVGPVWGLSASLGVDTMRGCLLIAWPNIVPNPSPPTFQFPCRPAKRPPPGSNVPAPNNKPKGNVWSGLSDATATATVLPCYFKGKLSGTNAFDLGPYQFVCPQRLECLGIRYTRKGLSEQ